MNDFQRFQGCLKNNNNNKRKKNRWSKADGSRGKIFLSWTELKLPVRAQDTGDWHRGLLRIGATFPVMWMLYRSAVERELSVKMKVSQDTLGSLSLYASWGTPPRCSPRSAEGGDWGEGGMFGCLCYNVCHWNLIGGWVTQATKSQSDPKCSLVSFKEVRQAYHSLFLLPGWMSVTAILQRWKSHLGSAHFASSACLVIFYFSLAVVGWSRWMSLTFCGFWSPCPCKLLPA